YCTATARQLYSTLSLHDALPISSFIENNPNFLPQRQGNYWVYDVKNEQETGRDSLYISDKRTASMNTYYSYSTQNEVPFGFYSRSEEHTSELQSRENLVCRLLLA